MKAVPKECEDSPPPIWSIPKGRMFDFHAGDCRTVHHFLVCLLFFSIYFHTISVKTYEHLSLNLHQYIFKGLERDFTP